MFADENIPPKLVELIRVFDRHGNTIEAHKDHFAPGTPDEDWLLRIGGWHPQPAILSGDARILRNPAQLAVIQQIRLHVVIFTNNFINLEWDKQAPKMLEIWTSLVSEIQAARVPTVFKVKPKPACVEPVQRVSDIKCKKNKDNRNSMGQSRSA